MLTMPDVELLGRKWGWKVEGPAGLAAVAAAARAGLPVAVYQDAGRRDWWQAFEGWPHHFERIADWPGERSEGRWAGLLAVSDRRLPPPPAPLVGKVLVYRPATLVLGAVCHPDLTAEELAEAVAALFERAGLSLASLTAVAAPAVCRDVAALADFADERHIPFLAYAEEKFRLIERHVPGYQAADRPGGLATSGPAALLAAGVKELIVPETAVRPGLTVAVARRAVG